MVAVESIRCPFNNFSKCNPHCPFSTTGLDACSIASRLIAIEGKVEGMLQHVCALSKSMEDGIKVSVEDAAADTQQLQEQPKLPLASYGSIEDYVDTKGVDHFKGIKTNDAYREFIKECKDMPIARDNNGSVVSQRTLTNAIMRRTGLMTGGRSHQWLIDPSEAVA